MTSQSRGGLIELASMLVAEAEYANDMRQYGVVHTVSRLLSETALADRFESVGLYYSAKVQYGWGRWTQAIDVLERTFDRLPDRFRSKTLLALAQLRIQLGDVEGCRLFSQEAGKLAAMKSSYNLRTLCGAHMNVAVCKSFDGDNSGALRMYRDNLPMARFIGKWYPYIYLDYLNNIAVDLMEAGRLEEAEQAIAVPMASPWAGVVVDWQDTARTIALAMHRKLGRPSSAPVNLMLMSPSFRRPHKRFSSSQIDGMTRREKMRTALDLISSGDIDDRSLSQIISFLQDATALPGMPSL
jgi:hypothetical protein